MTYTQHNIHELLPNITQASLRAAIATQGLPARKIGRNTYFDAEAVRAWLAGQREQAAHEGRKRAVRASKDDPKRYVDEIGE